ncbi:MAG: Zn-dependent hydrolase [Anaerolineaceae bacterium 4572_32.1]|nr:MAG: Zn-dependent hydrolase [Anaerolineaceae bacterium 4572_32.1]
MLKNIHWLGHDSFRIDADKTIYLDPWQLRENSPPAADLVLVSHEHGDHCSPSDIAKIVGSESVVVTNAASAAKLEGLKGQVRIVKPGDSLSAHGISIEAVPAYNLNKFRSPGNPFHPQEAGHVGFIITVGGQRIYHAGDTDNIAEMEGFEVDIALLPVSGTYVMTAEEAAEAARRIGPKIAVPMHYGAGVAGTRADAERFARLYDGKVLILEKE